jgi:Tfp pilus assembly protein PilN
MKAVNLIPSDNQGGRAAGLSLRTPALIPLGLLALALALVAIYVLTQNSISDRRVKLATAQAELSVVQAQAGRLTQYTQFQQLAQARIQTIKQIATSRFDWDAALSNLAKVVPANTSLQALLGTVSPDASVNSSAGGSSVPTSQSLRSAIAAPAFAMQGCTKSHDDVARLMSRLRLMNGVQRVTLADSQKSDNSQGGASVSSGSASAGGCGANSPSFDLIVFFEPLPGASTTTVGGSSATGVATTATSTATATTPAGTATTPAGTATTATTSTTTPGASR